jgi:hypothetical protein
MVTSPPLAAEAYVLETDTSEPERALWFFHASTKPLAPGVRRGLGPALLTQTKKSTPFLFAF